MMVCRRLSKEDLCEQEQDLVRGDSFQSVPTELMALLCNTFVIESCVWSVFGQWTKEE
jgi:hypothetical protein